MSGTATAFASLKSALMAVHGCTATLVAQSWRKDNLTICLLPGWNSSSAGGIGIERVEPTALVDSADIADYEFENGWLLEVGTDTYRVMAQAADDMGTTTLTLAKT
jgi:hypothetical protein